jgi:methylglutaconyl-CoA hydratase
VSGKLQVERRGDVADLQLARPGLRNALDEELIGALRSAFDTASADATLRVVLLRGLGKSFCAGADVNYMQRLAQFDHAANLADARALSELFLAISSCPKPVVAQVHGAAIGGGIGLLAACDIVLAAEGTQFALTEVRLGILPAVISPFVLRRLGPAACRALFLSGERIVARRALELGLVDRVVAAEELDATVAATIEQLRSGGPQAQAACKRLLDEIAPLAAAEAAQRTPEYIATQRASAEAREDFAAFFAKRPPDWAAGKDRA